jgi:aminoglycoside phosphotransferase (APT) family kinase protein
MYRLGDDMAVRLPRIQGAVADMEREYQWLPRLAAQLPVAIPVPLGKGTSAEGYPAPVLSGNESSARGQRATRDP